MTLRMKDLLIVQDRTTKVKVWEVGSAADGEIAIRKGRRSRFRWATVNNNLLCHRRNSNSLNNGSKR
jgi:hypothetical protein